MPRPRRPEIIPFTIEHIHRVASRVRGLPVVRDQRWLWDAVQPRWDRLWSRAGRSRGMLVDVNGDRLRLEYAYAARYSKSGYEPLIHEVFTTTIRPGMVVLDIGAHVGFFTLAAALRVGPGGSVFAFEPAPDTAAVLARHVAMNRWGNRVEVVRSAVSDREGTLSFFTLGTTMAASLSREHVEASPEPRTSAPEEVSVATVTLDGFCRSRGVAPDRIKIDVEGAEVLVLRGAREILESDAEILCEVHPAAIGLFQCSVDELHELVAAAGRRVTAVDAPNEIGIYHVLITREGADRARSQARRSAVGST